jgi:pachytene checkpoint protein 2
VVELGLPDAPTRARIIAVALTDLAVAWPGLKDLAEDRSLHDEMASRTAGWDGRRLRKLPLAVLGADPALARDPATLTAVRLRAAVSEQPLPVADEDNGLYHHEHAVTSAKIAAFTLLT